MSQKKIDELVKNVIQKIAVGPNRGRDISEQDASRVMQAILEGKIDPVQIAVILIALRMKRESMEEFQGLFQSMQSEVVTVDVAVDDLYCVADPFDGYVRHLSMTPFIPAVLAANGFNSLMIGVESVGPKFGVTAHQVLKAANIGTDLGADAVANNLAETGWGYLDQREYAPRLHALGNLRERIIKRSAVTTLERLMMPLKGSKNTHLVLGYVHKAYPEIYTSVARQAGYTSALLVKGVEGGLAPAINKPLRQVFTDFRCEGDDAVRTTKELPESIRGDKAAEPLGREVVEAVKATLELGLSTLNGAHGLARNSLVVATSQIIVAHSETDSFSEVIEKVQRSLDNGAALETFKLLVAPTA